jgi:MoxR-like ATPase
MHINQIIEQMLEVVNNKFPDWSGFDDPRFIKEETGYKRQASEKAKELLGKDVFKSLLDEKNYDEIIKRIEKVGQSTNLLYLSFPKSGDLGIIYQDNLNKKEFCEVFFNLLYGSDETKKRFKRYLHYVINNNLKNTYTFPTYFLFLLFPETEMFIKPTLFHKLVKMIDTKLIGVIKPNSSRYEMIKTILMQIKNILNDKLKDNGPKDMIDVQSFIWVAVKSGVEANDTVNFNDVIEKAKSVNFNEKDILREKDGRDKFVEKFPIENFHNMTIEEYADAENNDSFCYWLEFKKEIPMGIGGGNASKFGIYKAKDGNYYKGTKNKKILLDGNDLKNEFSELKNNLLKCFELIKNDKNQEIKNIDIPVWNMVLIKIFWLYFPDKFIDIGAPDWLTGIAEMIELKTDYDIKDEQNTIRLNYDIKKYLRQHEPFNQWNDYQFGIFFWQNYDFKKPSKPKNNDDSQPNYWIMNTTGMNEYLQQNGIVALDKHWNDLDDFKKYKSKKDIQKSLIQLFPDMKRDQRINALAAYEFSEVIKPGDYIFAIHGIDARTPGRIVTGFCKIISDYIYKEDAQEYKHIRKVYWLRTGEWNDDEGGYIQKRLTQMNIHDKRWGEDWEKCIKRLLNLVHFDPENQKRYWKIGTGKDGHLWEEFIEKSEIGIGFGKLENLDDFQTKEDLKSYIDLHDDIAKGVQKQIKTDEIWNFKNIKIGDIIIANQGITKIKGIAEIISKYKYYDTLNEYMHRYKVKWIETEEKKLILKHDWKWMTVDEITEEEYKMLLLGKSPWDNKPLPPSPKPESYYIDKALSELFIEKDELQSIINTLKYKKNIVLQGAPGVGKTFIARRIAWTMMGEKDADRVQMIQFHQSYSYEDFIQGYRPTDDGGFDIKNGVFYDFCKKAQRNPDKEYFFVIDEINRGNLSKIFGELMMLIEKDKRGKDFAIPLTYSKNEYERFYLPENLYFIGTMNTADRSLAMVDYALRRRFGFITLEPAFSKPKFKSLLKECKVPDDLITVIIERMNSLNENISKDNKNLGEGYRIGHSYFCPEDGNENDIAWYKGVIKNEIEPLLMEYWFDNKDKVEGEIKKLLDL